MLSDDELGKVVAKAATMPYPFGPIVMLLILTGQRRGEIASLKWSYIDRDNRTITLPAMLTKNRRQHTFPFGQGVADIFDVIPEQGEYLFPASRDHVRGVSIRRGPRRVYFIVLRWIAMRLERLSMPNWEKAMVPSGCSGS